MTFIVKKMIITKINFKIVNPLTDTFDDFIDDILSSDFHLLKGELDILLMQNSTLLILFTISIGLITYSSNAINIILYQK